MRAKSSYAMAVVVSAVVLAWSPPAARMWADEGHSSSGSTAPEDVLSMKFFYTGDGQLGVFSGTLVCLRCDLARAPGAAEQCKKEGHRHALSMQDGSMIHPLLSGTEEIQKQINSSELHGKKVKVNGKYYPATGLILVTQVIPAG